MNDVLEGLLAGNAEHAEAFDASFDELQEGQQPGSVTVCCSDSRVLGDHMWGNDEPGRVFTCGNIGNRVVQHTDAGRVVSGDVLYPIEHTGTETAIVVGHTGCGAVTATYAALTDGLSEPPGIAHCIDVLASLLEDGVEALPSGVDDSEAINHLVEYNVDRQVDALVESDVVPETVDVVGAVYDFQDVYSGRRGEIHVVNVDGEIDAGRLRKEYPEIRSRIERRWEY